MAPVYGVRRAGMVCAFVTNQLLHDQTSSSSDDSDADGDSAADMGLVTSLVDTLHAVDNYQQSTARVTLITSPQEGCKLL